MPKLEGVNEMATQRGSILSPAGFDSILEHACVIPWAADADTWRMTYVGPQVEKILGYSRDEWLGQDFWSDHIHPEDRDWVIAFCEEHSMTDTDYQFEYRFLKQDGESIWLHDVVSVERKKGAPKILRGFMIDITDRRSNEVEVSKLREQIAHVSRVSSLGQLSTSLAHELNQPLTAIMNNAQTAIHLLSGLDVDANDVADALSDIVDDTKRAGSIITSLRKFLRKNKPEMLPLSINDLTNEMLQLVHSESIIEYIHISLDLEPASPKIRGNRTQLQQVLLNLILNARDAMSDKDQSDRTMCIRTTQSPSGEVSLSITDSGPGMNAEVLEKLFEPFYTTKANGMGIGLSISQSIIEFHGGRILAENQSGGGATFTFVLPAYVEEKT